MKKAFWTTDIIIFSLSLFVCAFWIVGKSINVYTFQFIGAFYELFALPTLVLGITIPVIAVYRIFTKRAKHVLLPIASILLILITITFVSWKHGYA